MDFSSLCKGENNLFLNSYDQNYFSDDNAEKNNISIITFNDDESLSHQKENPNKIINLEEKSTAIKTLNNAFNENNITENMQNKPKFYYFEDIHFTLKEANFNLLEHFTKDKKIETEENEEKEINRIGKKRNRKLDEEINTNKYGKGRKKRDDETSRNHNKYFPDNIIKKIKVNFIKNLLLFVNNLFKKKNGFEKNNKVEKEKILKDLDYKKYIDKLNKEFDLQMLNMSVRELLSLEITRKYSTYEPNFNKTIIDYVLEKNNDNEILKFVFNMTFREWINFYTLKKKVLEIENVSDEVRNSIKDNLPKLESLLNDIYKKNKNDNRYLSYFIFYLFNYENWFFNKREKKKRNKFPNV